jgi:hypothetical protein
MELIMPMIAIKRQYFIFLVTAILLLITPHCQAFERKKSNMTAFTHRVQHMFERTKTVCFGRFMLDLPSSTTVVWGNADLPLGINIYGSGISEVNTLAQNFIDELKSDKAIYLNNVPLFISVSELSRPEGKIVVGYDGFEAIAELKINGYFKLGNDGVVIDARPLERQETETIAEITSIAQRLRHRDEDEIPVEPGNCIESAFLPDSRTDDKEHPGELLNIGFRLKEFPDAHFSISIRPSNYNDPESDSLKRQWKHVKEDPVSPEEKRVLARIKYFRERDRQIGEWNTGYEVLTRSPDEKGVHSYHDFEVRFIGVGHDPYKPYASIQFQTGVAHNAAGAAKTTLTDEEAIAIWDKVTSTVRVRPTQETPAKNATAKSAIALGELAATGRICSQTGWWQATESGNMQDGGRRHINAGERMPHVMMFSVPSIWQKLRNEQPRHRMATVWKLVDYDDASIDSNATTETASITRKDAENLTSEGTTPGGPKSGVDG